MDSELMNGYIDYLGHLEKSVKEKFCDYGFDLGIIPDGLTSLCQPLDVVINKPFKANLHSFKTCGISNALDEVEDFDNEIIDISDDDLEDGINDNLENDVSDDNLEDDISCDYSDIGINE
ncbi:pogo transposable element with KRAB domain-like [Rhizophagus irregularis DAOM 181602=DAOM 197198]|nr:pogo transposable element with KRAB domain-like [Rhizophagus irregularis DAOM 181602=DAOM 197198]